MFGTKENYAYETLIDDADYVRNKQVEHMIT